MKKIILCSVLVFTLAVETSCGSRFQNRAGGEAVSGEAVSREAVSGDQQIEGIDINRIIDAYINIENMLRWEEVRTQEKKYEDIKNIPIRDDQNIEIYKALNLNEQEIRFYFLVKDTENRNYPYNIRSLSYSLVQDEFTSAGGLIYETDKQSAKDTLKEEESAIYVKTEYVEYPAVFFPKYNDTTYKREVIDSIKSYIGENGIKWLRRGDYQVYIKNFSAVDGYAEVMFLESNKKKKQYYIVPLQFDNDKQGVHISTIPSSAESIEDLFYYDDGYDYDCGGIQYSELFAGLSVEKFEYKAS